MRNDKNLIDQVIEDGRIIYSDQSETIHEDAIDQKLMGVIPGGKSAEVSDEPGFHEIDDVKGPSGIILTSQKHREAQNASFERYEIDSIYRGILDGFIHFIIGRGFQVKAIDENPAVQDYLNRFMAINKFDGRDRQIVSKVIKGGETFIRFFRDADGNKEIPRRIAMIPTIRTLNYWEISDIQVSASDSETVYRYKRIYRDEKNEIQTEKIESEDMIHIKFADFEQKRGLPPFSVLIKGCQWYADWIFNRIVLNRTKTAYYLEEIITGTPAQTTAASDMHPDALKKGKAGGEVKRMPKPGSKITHNKAVEYKWLSPEVKADDAKEDGRAIRLLICAGAQCPEFLLGDSSQSNYASSLVSQNPFVRKVQFFQDFFEAYFKEIFSKAIQHGIDVKALPRLSTETVTRENAADRGWGKMLISRFFGLFQPENVNLQERNVGDILRETVEQNGDAVIRKVVQTKIEVDIQWPTMIAQNLKEETETYQLQQSMGIASDETLSQKLGYDWNEERRRMMQAEIERKSGRPDDDVDDDFKAEDRDNEINKKDEPEE